MKRSIAAVVLTILATALFAQTTGELIVKGNVPGKLELTVVPDPAAQSLNLAAAGTQTVPVVTLNVVSNYKTGYTVAVHSTGGTVLKSTDGTNPDDLEYTLLYNGSPVTVTDTPTGFAGSSGKTTPSGTDIALSIRYTGDAMLYADDYTDTLMFTISTP